MPLLTQPWCKVKSCLREGARLVSVRQFLHAAATAAAVAGATATGGPIVGAEVAAFMASPVGRRATNAVIDQLAANQGVVLEDLATGGLITQPTLGFTGEAGPELVVPLVKPKRKRSSRARASDKKLSKAFKEANKRMRTKSGKLRKGKTQADIARLAHRLRKQMK